MIRDEHSDEVGDLWDAFSKALRRQGRDWMRVGKSKPTSVYAGGLVGAALSYRETYALNAAQSQPTSQSYRFQAQYPSQGAFGGLLGRLI